MTIAATNSPIAQRILDSATEMFARKGFAASSTREIVEAAGVTKPMLYYYFQSKEGLCRAALAAFFETFHEKMRQLFGQEIAPREFLVGVVWLHIEHCNLHRDCARLFYSLMFGPEEDIELFELEKYTAVSSELLRASVRRACEVGLVRPESEGTMYTALTGTINLSIMASLRSQEDALTQEAAAQMIDDLLQGFGRKNT